LNQDDDYTKLPTLSEILMTYEKTQDKIRVQNEKKHCNDSSIDSTYDHVYEYKAKDVIFDE
jgi:hypothetical protein